MATEENEMIPNTDMNKISYLSWKREFGFNAPTKDLIKQALDSGVLSNDRCKPTDKFLDKITEAGYLKKIEGSEENYAKLAYLRACRKTLSPAHFIENIVVSLSQAYENIETKLKGFAKEQHFVSPAVIIIGIGAYIEKKVMGNVHEYSGERLKLTEKTLKELCECNYFRTSI